MLTTPIYQHTFANGAFRKKIELAEQFLKKCKLCPRNCKIDRTNNEVGFCHSSNLPIVSAYSPHFGEEPVLSDKYGVGNIFFGNCNLQCVFCQNYEISKNRKDDKHNEITCEQLADIMLELQNKGCNNIGLVSPTHFSAQILKSIYAAIKKGLNIPIIYNSNGYDSVEMIKLLEGVIDIYLPDFKYGSNKNAEKFSNVNNYFEHTKNSIREMYKQVGSELICDGNIAVRGLIVRHLILPNELAYSERIFKFIAEELSPDIHISLMAQYFPTYKADKYILLDRKIYESELEKTFSLLEKYGLRNGWIQELDSSNYYKPNFKLAPGNPFNN